MMDELVYKTIVGLKGDLSGTAQNPEILKQDSENESNDSDSESSKSSDDLDETTQDIESKFVDSSRPKHETIEEKKSRKKACKDAQALKRKDKIKKHVKKRKERLGKKK